MKSINNPHDSFFKAAIKNLAVSEELIVNCVPSSVVDNLDLTQLELTSESHIAENFKPFMSDIIFKCPYKENDSVKDGKKYAKIPILVEHQSTPDELIAFRVYHYLFNFLYSELKRNKSKKLTAAYAIVIYHGEQTPYPYSLDLLTCFEDPHHIMKQFFENPIRLIDIGQIADDELAKQNLIGVVQQALKYSRSKHPETHIVKILQRLAALDFSSQRELQLSLQLITNYLFAVSNNIDVDKIIDLGNEIPQKVRGEYMTIAEQLEARGEARGKELGAKDNSILIATNLINLGLSNEVIVQSTGLTLEEVLKLRAAANQ